MLHVGAEDAAEVGSGLERRSAVAVAAREHLILVR